MEIDSDEDWDDPNAPLYKMPTLARPVPKGFGQSSWDFSLATTSDRRSNVQKIGDEEFQGKLNESNVFGNCQHKIITVTCPCKCKKDFTKCLKCGTIFCAESCVAFSNAAMAARPSSSLSSAMAARPSLSLSSAMAARPSLSLSSAMAARPSLSSAMAARPSLSSAMDARPSLSSAMAARYSLSLSSSSGRGMGRGVKSSSGSSTSSSELPSRPIPQEEIDGYNRPPKPRKPIGRGMGRARRGKLGGFAKVSSTSSDSSEWSEPGLPPQISKPPPTLEPAVAESVDGAVAKAKPAFENCYTDVELPLHKKIPIVINHVNDLEDFYILRADDVPTVERLETNINRLASFTLDFLDLNQPLPIIGCVAVSHKKWARCKVVSREGKLCKVIYIDRGTVGEDVETNGLRVLPEEFEKHYPYAYHCKLDIKPTTQDGTWLPELCEALRDLAKRDVGDHVDGGHVILKCIGYDKGTHIVELSVIGGKDWSSLLVETEFAVRPAQPVDPTKPLVGDYKVDPAFQESEDEEYEIERTFAKTISELRVEFPKTFAKAVGDIKKDFPESEDLDDLEGSDILCWPPIGLLDSNMRPIHNGEPVFTMMTYEYPKVKALIGQKVFVTAGKWPFKLNIMPAKDKKRNLIDMQDNVTEWAEKYEKLNWMPQLNSILLAIDPSHKEKEGVLYFRAFVRGVYPTQGVLEVENLDLGTMSFVDLEDCRDLEPCFSFEKFPSLSYRVMIDTVLPDKPFFLKSEFDTFIATKPKTEFTLENVYQNGVVSLSDTKSGRFIQDEIKLLGKWQWEHIYDIGCYHTDDDIINKGNWQTTFESPGVALPIGVDVKVEIVQVDYSQKDNTPPYLLVKPAHPALDELTKVLKNQVARYMRKVKPSQYCPSTSEVFFLLPPEGEEGAGLWQRCFKLESSKTVHGVYYCIDTGVSYKVVSKAEYQFRKMCPEFWKIPRLIVTSEFEHVAWDDDTPFGKKCTELFTSIFHSGDKCNLMFLKGKQEEIRQVYHSAFAEKFQELRNDFEQDP